MDHKVVSQITPPRHEGTKFFRGYARRVGGQLRGQKIFAFVFLL
jgi:hypothetical protein